MSQLPRWLSDLKRTLPTWIDRVAHPTGGGRYRFAIDAFEPFDLDSSHMLHNVVYTTGGGRDGLPDELQRQRWIEYLLGLQRGQDGLMIDPGMERHLVCANAHPTDDELFALRRWTTRNGLLTVMELGGKPRYRVAHREVFESPEELVSHIESLDWSLPWAAGSRTGAVVLFQHFNRLLGDERSDELIRAAVDWLIAHQDPRTGAWSNGDANVSLHQLINGIMKVWIQLLPITDLPVQYAQRVVDLCIRGIKEDPFIAQKVEACSVFDVALVLDIALRHTDHRREEIADLARTYLPRFEAMVAPDGALSYHPGRSLDSHSGLLLGPIKNQSDAVGTSIHCHAIALLAHLGGLRNHLGWTPLTEWRMQLSPTPGLSRQPAN